MLLRVWNECCKAYCFQIARHVSLYAWHMQEYIRMTCTTCRSLMTKLQTNKRTQRYISHVCIDAKILCVQISVSRTMCAEMLEKLPEDVVYKILDLVDVHTRARLMLVNRYCKHVASRNWGLLELSTQKDGKQVFGCLKSLADSNSTSLTSLSIEVNWTRGDFDIPGDASRLWNALYYVQSLLLMTALKLTIQVKQVNKSEIHPICSRAGSYWMVSAYYLINTIMSSSDHWSNR